MMTLATLIIAHAEYSLLHVDLRLMMVGNRKTINGCHEQHSGGHNTSRAAQIQNHD